jgi:ABC-2 type transport system permease protein
VRNIFNVAFNHINNIRKDKLAWVVFLLLPLVLAFVTGMAFGGSQTASGDSYQIAVAVVDLDGGPIGGHIASLFQQDPFLTYEVDEETGREMLRERSISTLVIIPAGLERALSTGNAVSIAVVRTTAQEGPRLVEQHLTAELARIRAATAAAAIVTRTGSGLWMNAFATAQELWPVDFQPVQVKVENLGPRENDSFAMGYNLASPGYIVMFGLMSITAAGAASILQERQMGTLARLLSAPLSRGGLIMGKVMGLIFMGILQMTILIVAGQLLFGVNWGQSPLALALIVVSFSFAAAGLGMFLASICNTASQANAYGVLIVLVLTMLGGTWWPMELMPRTVQLISRLVPSGWAMSAFTDIILRGYGMEQLWLHSAVLLAFGSVFTLAGTKLFRYH